MLMHFSIPTAAVLVTTSRTLYVSRSRKVRAPFSSRFETKRTWRSAKQFQQVADHPAAGLALIDGRLEELALQFFYLLQSALLLKSIDERLDRRVSDTFVLRKAFQDLAHRRVPSFPVLLQNSSFGFGKTPALSMISYLLRQCYYKQRILAILRLRSRGWHCSSYRQTPLYAQAKHAWIVVSPSAVEKFCPELQYSCQVVDKY